MNRAYRLVWSHTHRTWIAASEIARTNGKGMVKAGTLAAVLACASPAAWATDTYWNAGTGDWFTTGNWDTGAVPIIGDTTYIDNGGTPQVQTAGAQAASLAIGLYGTGHLEISNGGTLSSVWTNYIGDAVGSSGTVTVDGIGSTLTSNEHLAVGSAGTGTLTLSNGAQVNVAGTASIGTYSTSSGTATVDGAGSSLNNSQLFVGNEGTGAFTISNGGTVSTSSRGIIGVCQNLGCVSTGTVTVDGAGSSWSNSGTVTLGFDRTGAGTLVIRNGGTVSNTDAVLGDSAIFGNSADTRGTVTVEGAGSSWSNSGNLTIGKYGTGTLTVSNGGAVSNTDGILGHSAGSSGTATVDGIGSSWSNSGNLFVGSAGTGTLTLSNGGTVSNTDGYLGYSASGAVTVDGAGSTWANTGYLYLGYDNIGALTISNGGAVNGTESHIAMSSSSNGTATVDGIGSTWTNSSNLFVGDTGTGTLTISNGGAVSNTNGSLGSSVGSNGTATVDGAGSGWSNSGNLTVGNVGTGTLTISNGGAVSNTDGSLGSTVGSNGTATVDGAGSSWNNSGNLTVGNYGTGTLTVSNGATVNVAAGTGTVTLAKLSGFSGSSSGTLNIGDGGMAGILNAARVTGGTGTATLNFNHTDGNYYFTSDSTAGGTAINITGSTAVNQIGSGTTILTGTNTYSGGTTVTAGTLRSGSAGAVADNTSYTVNGGTLDLNGNDLAMSALSGTGGYVTLGGATLTVNQSTDTGYAGDISGSGSLTKSGSGILTLSGTNAYSGGTTVSAGTLQGTTTSLQGAITNNAAVVFDQSSDGTYSGDMSGSGSLAKSGTGTLTLTGSNSYSGGTTISAGTLQGDTTSLQGAITNNATVVFEQAADGTYSDDISGSGSLIKSGSGILTLTGSNSYSGGTTISAGTLQGDTTSLQGAITNNATVTFDQSANGTYSGDISGSGSLIKSGSGILTLSGSNTYSGGTTVSAGTLQGNTTSLQGAITNNATVVFDQATDGTYADDMDGSGSLSKTGTGTLYLTGINTYSGATTITNGTLSVNGSITSTTTVNSGATLKGSGSVGSVTLSGGTVAPGNSIGTLNVAGDIDLSGGTYEVEVDAAGNSDQIIATGTATLTGGSVQVVAAAGTYSYSTDYTVLTAGSLSGSFNSVSSNLAFLDPTLSYDATHAYLNLARNDVSYGSVASTSNQQAVGSALTTTVVNGAGGDMQTLTNTVNTLSASGARQAYDSLSGVQHANAQSLLLGANGHFTGLINSRSSQLAANPGVAADQAAAFTPIQLAYNGDLSDLPLASNGTTAGLMETQGSGFWLAPQGGTGSIKDTANATGADYTWYGLYGGADTWLDNHRLVGFALGVSHTDANPTAGDINLDSLELAAYGRWQDDKRYLDASINAGRHRTETSRHVSVGALTRTASADYDAQSLGLSVEAGQSIFDEGDQRVTPFIGLRYARLNRDGFSETGAGGANLTVDSDTQESLQGRIGVNTEQHSETTSGRRLDWDLSVAWARELRDSTSTLNAGFEGAPSTTFSVNGPQLDRNRVQVGVGLTTDIGRATTLCLGYNGELASSHQSHAISANVRVLW